MSSLVLQEGKARCREAKSERRKLRKGAEGSEVPESNQYFRFELKRTREIRVGLSKHCISSGRDDDLYMIYLYELGSMKHDVHNKLLVLPPPPATAPKECTIRKRRLGPLLTKMTQTQTPNLNRINAVYLRPTGLHWARNHHGTGGRSNNKVVDRFDSVLLV